VVKARKTPLRTCIGCGTGSDKKSLIRIVRTPEGDVTVDPTGKANGRGAYICASTDCFDAALRRKRLDSALRVRLNEEELDRLRREFDSAISALSQGR
jgi:hypothetical protein